MPRSGTSMISGILANHGAFFGNCKKPNSYNPKGYFENIEIHKKIRNNPKSYLFTVQEIKQIMCNEGYKEGQLWAVKHGVSAYKKWGNFNPTFICCIRDLDSTMKSINKVIRKDKTPYTLNEFKYIYNKNIDTMYKVGHHFIKTSEVINNDYSSIKKIINKLGLVYDENILKDFINPNYWNYYERKS